MKNGSRQKTAGNENLLWLEWKQRHNINKPLRHNEGSSKRRVHSTQCLLDKNLRVLIFVTYSTSGISRTRRINTPKEYMERNSGLKSLN